VFKKVNNMQSKKGVMFIICISIVMVLVLSVCAFFSIPFVKLNNLSKSLNNGNTTANISDDASHWVTNQCMDALTIVDEINEDEYAEIKNKKSIKEISFNKIVIDCDIYIKVRDWETWEVIKEYNANRIVTFRFSKWQWRIENVQIGQGTVL